MIKAHRLFLALLCSYMFVAEDVDAANAVEEANATSAVNNATFLESWLIEPRDYLSNWVMDTSNDIDLFFSGEYSEQENVNESYLRAQSGFTFVESNGVVEQFDFTARIRLHRLERLFYFEIESLDESSEDPNVGPGDRTVERSVQDPADNLAAALRFVIRQTRDFSLQGNLGIRMGMPADPFGKLRVRKSFVIYKWEHRFEEELYYFYVSGWESIAAYTASRVYTDQILLQLHNQLIIKPRQRTYGLNNTLSLAYQYNYQNGGSLFTGMQSERYDLEPFKSKNYSAGVRYRRKVLGDWLFFDVQPQYVWPKEREFRPTAQILFNLTLLIGYAL